MGIKHQKLGRKQGLNLYQARKNFHQGRKRGKGKRPVGPGKRGTWGLLAATAIRAAARLGRKWLSIALGQVETLQHYRRFLFHSCGMGVQRAKETEGAMSSEKMGVTVATALCGLDLSTVAVTPTALSALTLHVTLGKD